MSSNTPASFEDEAVFCQFCQKMMEQITGALNAIMLYYGVPEEIRQRKIKKVMAVDYREIGRKILAEFKEYVKKEKLL